MTAIHLMLSKPFDHSSMVQEYGGRTTVSTNKAEVDDKEIVLITRKKTSKSYKRTESILRKTNKKAQEQQEPDSAAAARTRSCHFDEQRNQYFESPYCLFEDDDLDELKEAIWYNSNDIQSFQANYQNAPQQVFHQAPHRAEMWTETLSAIYKSNGMTTVALRNKLADIFLQAQELVGVELGLLNPKCQVDATMRRRALTRSILHLSSTAASSSSTPSSPIPLPLASTDEQQEQAQHISYISRRLSILSGHFAHEIALALAQSLELSLL
ncbi:hypothetical protein ACA910_011595 [Epithemia clementina (nom. ined.)]